MRTAIYIEDGVTQVVLTPEQDGEKEIIKMLAEALANGEATIHRGRFWDCQGGWTRLSPQRHYPYGDTSHDESLIVRVSGPRKATG